MKGFLPVSRKRALLLSTFSVALLAASCAVHPRGEASDKTDWQARAGQVELGMTRDQVRQILPLWLGRKEGIMLGGPINGTITGAGLAENYWVSENWQVTLPYDLTGGEGSASNRVTGPVGIERVRCPRAKHVPVGDVKPRRPKVISSEADLAMVIKQLQYPDTRFQAFLELIDFAGYPKGNVQTEDPQLNRLHATAIQAMRECPDLDGVIATMIRRLDDPNHRMEMLAALLKFAGSPLQMGGGSSTTGSAALDALLGQATQATSRSADVATVGQALRQPDWMLRMWAGRSFGNPLGQPEEWKALLSEMEKLASDEDPAVRREAALSMGMFPGTRKFLEDRFTKETSPDVLLELPQVRFVTGDEFKTRFLARFVSLLSHPDESVRHDALLFVGFNSSRAEVLQFPFGQDVFDQVIRATRSKSAKERAAAAYALTDIRRLDPDTSREAFIRLANDPEKDVRWRVAAGLAGQFEREDVKPIIASLLKDKAPDVRYMTIVAVGPEKFVPQLQELSHAPDPRVAEWASEKLKQMGESKEHHAF